MKTKFNITGMSCSACSAHVENAVFNLKGVNDVSVNLLTNSMMVEFDDNILSIQDIIRVVEEAGYGAELTNNRQTTKKEHCLNVH